LSAVAKALDVATGVDRRKCETPSSCYPDEPLCEPCDKIERAQDKLFAPLAAVARAAMARPWWRRYERANGTKLYSECEGCGVRLEPNEYEKPRGPEHPSECCYRKTDAALDALEAAAKGSAS